MSVRNTEQTTAPLSRLEIRLDAIDHNVAELRRLVGPDVTICGVVKKNAYGLGAVTLAHRLLKAGCGMLAVYSPAEAEALNAGAVTAPILLYFPLRHLARTEGLYRPAVAERLHLSIHDPEQLEQLEQLGRTFGIRLPVHLFVDTGLSRGGLTLQQAGEILTTQPQRAYTRLAGIMTHLATAPGDPARAQKQIERFDTLLEEHAQHIPADTLIHLANTYGTMRADTYHRRMVRPGLGLYGYGDGDLIGDPQIDPPAKLRPCLRWVSRLVHVGHYPRHAAVGYGATHKLKRNSVLGLVPVGYADGYPLGLSGRGSVGVRRPDSQERCDCPVLGRVNMDQITVDLTDLVKEAGSGAHDFDPSSLRGAEVEIYSDDPSAPHAVSRLAELAQSNAYELLCRLSPTLPRVYV